MSRMTAPDLEPGDGLIARNVTLPDSRALRVVEAGSGGPLVVFEAGMGAAAGSWVTVQRHVAGHTRTLSYDRAGYGGSDVDPAARTLDRLTQDLGDLLDSCGETEPVILIGHSWAGAVLRSFAAQHPQRIAGLVFVDATIAQVIGPVAAKSAGSSFAIMGMLGKVGLTRLLTKALLAKITSAEVAAEDKQIMLRDVVSARGCKAAREEARHMPAALVRLRQLQEAGLPDVPTLSLLGGRAERGAKKARQTLNHVTTREMELLRRGTVEVVDGATHYVPQQQPALTAIAILRLLERQPTEQ